MLAHLANERANAGTARPFPPSDWPLNLLPERREERTRGRWLAVIGGSLLAHLLFFSVAIKLPSFETQSEPERRVVIRRVPLYLPPDVLTQKAPNKAKPTENIDLASLLASEQSHARKAAPEASQKHFELPKQAMAKPATNASPQILPEPPKVALNQASGPLPPGAINGIGAPAPPPPMPSQSPFQNVGTEAPPANPHPTIAPPKATIQEAMKGVIQSGTSTHLVISDASMSEPSPTAPGVLRQPGAEHTAVELQSDPAGADFKAYLTRILAIVRGNWKRVIPESARMGTMRGRTVMEFIINRDGTIPKLVTAESSGIEPLDRAAIAGLSMSNPLPALPADYKGFQVRLAFTFSYNLPNQ